MNIDQLRQLCLSFPGATEQIQWSDVLLFKVGGRMFALTPLEPASPWLSLKADPEAFAELVERPGVIPAPYLARAKWIAIETRDALPASEVAALLRRSYELVVAKLPRAAREKLSRPKTETKPRGARRKARPPRAASRKTRP